MATTAQYGEPTYRSGTVANIGWIAILVVAVIAWLFAGALPCRQALWVPPILLLVGLGVAALIAKAESRKRGFNMSVEITWKEILALLIFVLAMVAVAHGADAATLMGIVITPLSCDDSKKSAIELLLLGRIWG